MDKTHWRWINELRKFRYPHQQVAFEELKRAIRQIEERIITLDQAIEDGVKLWRFAPIVDALRALRGVNTAISATLAAEIRFSSPRQLMAWLGLVQRRAFQRQHGQTRTHYEDRKCLGSDDDG